MVRVDTWEAWVVSLPTQFRVPKPFSFTHELSQVLAFIEITLMASYVALRLRSVGGITTESILIAFVGIV